MSSSTVKRISLFKIPKEEDIDAIIAEYQVLRDTAQKDGKPYIVSNEAKRIVNSSDKIADGYTMLGVTVFKSKADYDYYDKECSAHKKLREFIGQRRTGVATVCYESDL